MALDYDCYEIDPDTPAVDRVKMLSSSEYKVVDLACRGLSNAEIAAKLDLSIRTVETYRRHATLKLGSRTAADMARVFIEGVTGVALP